MSDPDIDQLRRLRSQRKGVITRHLGTLDRLVAEEDVDSVKERLERLKHAFTEFENVHIYYDPPFMILYRQYFFEIMSCCHNKFTR